MGQGAEPGYSQENRKMKRYGFRGFGRQLLWIGLGALILVMGIEAMEGGLMALGILLALLSLFFKKRPKSRSCCGEASCEKDPGKNEIRG